MSNESQHCDRKKNDRRPFVLSSDQSSCSERSNISSHVLASETQLEDNVLSESCIPPSQDIYGSVPLAIPNSPTFDMDVHHPVHSSSTTSTTFQEWQVMPGILEPTPSTNSQTRSNDNRFPGAESTAESQQFNLRLSETQMNDDNEVVIISQPATDSVVEISSEQSEKQTSSQLSDITVNGFPNQPTSSSHAMGDKKAQIPPMTMTLDMIDTQSQDSPSQTFELNRPNVAQPTRLLTGGSSDGSDVFARAKQSAIDHPLVALQKSNSPIRVDSSTTRSADTSQKSGSNGDSWDDLTTGTMANENNKLDSQVTQESPDSVEQDSMPCDGERLLTRAQICQQNTMEDEHYSPELQQDRENNENDRDVPNSHRSSTPVDRLSTTAANPTPSSSHTQPLNPSQSGVVMESHSNQQNIVFSGGFPQGVPVKTTHTRISSIKPPAQSGRSSNIAQHAQTSRQLSGPNVKRRIFETLTRQLVTIVDGDVYSVEHLDGEQRILPVNDHTSPMSSFSGSSARSSTGSGHLADVSSSISKSSLEPMSSGGRTSSSSSHSPRSLTLRSHTTGSQSLRSSTSSLEQMQPNLNSTMQGFAQPANPPKVRSRVSDLDTEIITGSPLLLHTAAADTMRFTSIVDRRSDDSATDPDAIAKMPWQPIGQIQQGSSNSSAVSKSTSKSSGSLSISLFSTPPESDKQAGKSSDTLDDEDRTIAESSVPSSIYSNQDASSHPHVSFADENISPTTSEFTMPTQILNKPDEQVMPPSDSHTPVKSPIDPAISHRDPVLDTSEDKSEMSSPAPFQPTPKSTRHQARPYHARRIGELGDSGRVHIQDHEMIQSSDGEDDVVCDVTMPDVERLVTAKNTPQSPEIAVINTSNASSHDVDLSKYSKGCNVFARWTDSHFYSGSIRSTQTTTSGRIRYMISFDDGTVLDVPILKDDKSQNDIVYKVQFFDGSCKKCKKKEISLTSNQGDEIKRNTGSDVSSAKRKVLSNSDTSISLPARSPVKQATPSKTTTFDQPVKKRGASSTTEEFKSPPAALKRTGSVQKRKNTPEHITDNSRRTPANKTSHRIADDSGVADVSSDATKITSHSKSKSLDPCIYLIPVSCNVLGTKYSPDTVVFGQWKDKFYYSGVISGYNERTSRYNVLFDDGSRRQIPHNEMVPLTLLHIGAEVLAQQSEDDDSEGNGFNELAKVTKCFYDEEQYDVTFVKDGCSQRCGRNGIILSELQANKLLEFAQQSSKADKSPNKKSHTPTPAPPSSSVLPILDDSQPSATSPNQSSTNTSAHVDQTDDQTDDHKHDGNISKDSDSDSDVEMDGKGTGKQKTLVDTPIQIPTTVERPSRGTPANVTFSDEAKVKVFARWRDGQFYTGHIVTQTPELDQYEVAFDDGDDRLLSASDLVLCSMIDIGQEVMANDGDDTYLLSHVKKVLDQGKSFEVVAVEDATKTARSCKLSALMLNQSQARQLRLSKEKFGILGLSKGTPKSNRVSKLSTKKSTSKSASPSTKKDKATSSGQDSGSTSAAKQIVPSSSKRSATKASGSTKKSQQTSKPPRKDQTSKMPAKSSETSAQIGSSGNASATKNKTTDSTQPTASANVLEDSRADDVEHQVNVFARWRDGQFYTGHIVKQIPEFGQYEVAFVDDDQHRMLSASDLVLCSMIDIGQEVMANDGDDTYLLSHVRKVLDQGKSFEVEAVDPSQGTRTCQLSALMLNTAQAKPLILAKDTTAIFATPKSADVTLENLVSGKRTRSAAQSTSSVKQQVTSSTSQKKRKHEDMDAASDSTGKLTAKYAKASGRPKESKKRLFDPKLTSTPTPKRVQKQITEVPVFENVGDSPQLAKKSRRRVQQSSMTYPEIIESLDHNIFKDIIFLITHVERSSNQLQEQRRLLKQSLSTSSSSADDTREEDSFLPFDRELIVQLVLGGGGKIMEEFSYQKFLTSSRCLLVSDHHQRTLKYINCLACNVPCVSHIWVTDCITQHKLHPTDPYTLPCGMSIETNTLIDRAQVRSPLRGMSVYLSSSDPHFIESWESVVTAAQCVVKNEKCLKSSDPGIEVIICDDRSPGDLPSTADNIVKVTTEWIVQTLITGKRRAFGGHPKYAVDL